MKSSNVIGGEVSPHTMCDLEAMEFFQKNIPKYQPVTSEFSVMGTGEQSPGEEKEICPARKDGGDIRDDRLVRQIPKTSETGPKGGNEKMCDQKTPEAILKCKYKKTLIQN